MKRTLSVVLLALVFASCASASTSYGWVRYQPHKKHHKQRDTRSHWLRHLSDRFIADALCVHDGWHHQSHRPYRRTWNVPDSIRGGTGEASWHDDGAPYYNGFQFAPSTWRRAGGNGYRIVSADPAEQIYRVYVIVVRQDGGSWREWPRTSRACGLPR